MRETVRPGQDLKWPLLTACRNFAGVGLYMHA